MFVELAFQVELTLREVSGGAFMTAVWVALGRHDNFDSAPSLTIDRRSQTKVGPHSCQYSACPRRVNIALYGNASQLAVSLRM